MVSFAVATPVHLRCEYRQNPLGIDAPAPHLSWQSDNTERNWKQSAYEIVVASSLDGLRAGQGDVWDSGKVNSDESVGIAYSGPALESRKRYYWMVRVWDAAGKVAESSEDAWWEMGLLRPEDWKAKWITWKNPEDEADLKDVRWIWVHGQDALAAAPKTSARFRVKVSLSEKPSAAVLVLAVRGDYTATVNGHQVGKKHEWGTFERRDIVDPLKVGDNDIEIKVAAPDVARYGPKVGEKTTKAALAALVKITKADGSIERIPSGEKWEAAAENQSSWQAANAVAELADKRLGDPGPLPEPAASFRRGFDVSKKVASARLYVTALGSYRVFLNGNRVSSDVLTPDFTDYHKRVLYQTYDVTESVNSGGNVVSALLGDGWYGSPLTWAGMHFFAPPNRLEAQLELTYADGSHDTVITDESWKASASPIVESQIYGGETYDARREIAGWQMANFDDSRWSAATIADAPSIAITSQPAAPVRVIETLAPKTVNAVTNDDYVFDMGQNMVGWVTLKVKGAAGTRVQLRFAERLNPDGTIYTENLRNADATDTYILKGEGDETFAPHFTFHGFRYVEVTGFPGKPGLGVLEGDVVSGVSGEPGDGKDGEHILQQDVTVAMQDRLTNQSGAHEGGQGGHGEGCQCDYGKCHADGEHGRDGESGRHSARSKNQVSGGWHTEEIAMRIGQPVEPLVEPRLAVALHRIGTPVHLPRIGRKVHPSRRKTESSTFTPPSFSRSVSLDWIGLTARLAPDANKPALLSALKSEARRAVAAGSATAVSYSTRVTDLGIPAGNRHERLFPASKLTTQGGVSCS